MANPKFATTDLGSIYIFEELPSLPSDRADLTSPPHKRYAEILHDRNGVVIDRKVIVTKYVWNLFFMNITKSMVDSLEAYFSEDFFLFYPDSDSGTYFTVYLEGNETDVALQRGGTYNMRFTLAQK